MLHGLIHCNFSACWVWVTALKLHPPPQSSILLLTSSLLSSQALPNGHNLWSPFMLCRWLKELIDLSLSTVWTKQINKVSGMCVKVNLGEVWWSGRSRCGVWSWPEKKDCDGVLSVDQREGRMDATREGCLLVCYHCGSGNAEVLHRLQWLLDLARKELSPVWSYQAWCH